MPEEHPQEPSSKSFDDYGFPSRYSNLRELGSGGMGTVLVADDLVLGRKIAIKVLQPQTDPDESKRERFLRETRLLASLEHNNIVKILNSGISEKGLPYYVMEIVEGESLAQVLARKKTLSSREFQTIFKQVLAGLSCAHKAKITHRDLKPGNIMLSTTEEGMRVKLIDFGIARVLEDQASGEKSKTITKTSALLGSPAYMSPEQCRGERGDCKSDIYSVGCIMYECISGQVPFSGAGVLEPMYKHMNESAPRLETQAVFAKWRGLASLIDRCLEKEPANRPSSAEELDHELAKLFEKNSDTSGLFLLPSRASQGQLKKSYWLLGVLVLIPAAFFSLSHFSKSAARRYKSEILNSGEQKIKTQEHTCNRLRDGFSKTRDSATKFNRGKALSIELSTLCRMKLADLRRDPDDKIKKLKRIEELLTEAISLTGSHKYAVDLMCTRAEVKLEYGDAKSAERDFEEASAYATTNLKKESWDSLTCLQRWAIAELNQKKWTSAKERISRLLNDWDIDNYLDHPNDSVGTRLSTWMKSLASKPLDSERGRLTQLELILDISERMLSKKADKWREKRNLSGEVASSSYLDTLQALLTAKRELVPKLDWRQENPGLLNRLNRLISSYEEFRKESELRND